MQVIRKLMVIFLAAFVVAAVAQVQQARGKATMAYKGKAAPSDVKAKAQQAAQLKAVEFYYAEAGEAESANFDAVRDKILENPDRYILETTLLSEDDNVANQQYTVAVRVSLNVANLRNAVKANSAVAKAGRSEKSGLSFVFVSRQIDTLKTYDARVYKRTDLSSTAQSTASGSQKSTEGESVGKSQISTNSSSSAEANAQAKVSVTKETGGSTTRKASESTWRLLPSANLNQVFVGTFTQAGYKVTDAATVESFSGGKPFIAALEDDYKSGNDLKPVTKKSIVDGMRAGGIRFVALGTLDVGLADKDSATGLMRVAVTVNATVLDVVPQLPETLASVGPVQYSSVGPTEEEARGSALKLAANNAAREISSQLTNLGLR